MTKVMVLRVVADLGSILRSVSSKTTTQRPALMSVAFWSVYGLTSLFALLGIIGGGITVEWVIHAVNITVVGALWFTLRWQPDGGLRALVPSAVFLAASFVLGITGSFGEHALLALIGFANLVFVTSIRVTVIVVVALAAALGVSSTLVFGNSVRTSVQLTLTVLGTAAFVVSLGLAIRQARERQEEAVVLARRIQELTLAEERARMSREIHDSVGHHLTVVTMNLENAELLKEQDPSTAWTQVAEAKHTVRSALADTRRWVRALNPASLQKGITPDSLRAFAATLAGTGVAITIEVNGASPVIDEDTQLVLYRTLQEGVTNAIRHAAASHVDVALHYQKQAIRLLIRNDGRALAEPPSEGFGLMSLRQRITDRGGSLTFELRDDEKFEATLEAEIPLITRDAS